MANSGDSGRVGVVGGIFPGGIGLEVDLFEAADMVGPAGSLDLDGRRTLPGAIGPALRVCGTIRNNGGA